jgi:hypothetical protein
VYKSGEKNDVNNYRPISVLPAISKIIEKMINNRLIAYLEKFKIISKSQFGFRKGLSTEDAVLALTKEITNQVDNGNKCLAIFLDLKKAFDTVSHSTLIHKLETMGIREKSLDLLSDYLHDRSQKVKIGNHISEASQISFGVPQGSVLGPTLFLAYINDLTNLIVEDGCVFSYADDTVVVFHGKTWESTYEKAERGLNTVSSWLNTNLLTLNIAKTNFMCFSKYITSQPPDELNIKIHSCTLPINTQQCSCFQIDKVTSTKYLGIILDQRLSWHKHIEYTNNRIRKLIWIFKKLRHIASKPLLTQLYTALAQSVMTYCIPVWGGANKTKFLEVERGQRCLLKVMHSKPYRFPTSELYQISNQLSMRKLYILNSTLKLHKTLAYKPQLPHRRRKNNVAHLPFTKSLFAKRQFSIQSAHLYNTINNKLSIYSLPLLKCKKAIRNWLRSLNYNETELLVQ